MYSFLYMCHILHSTRGGICFIKYFSFILHEIETFPSNLKSITAECGQTHRFPTVTLTTKLAVIHE